MRLVSFPLPGGVPGAINYFPFISTLLFNNSESMKCVKKILLIPFTLCGVVGGV